MIDFEAMIRSALAESDADTLAKAFTDALNKIEEENNKVTSPLAELEAMVKENTGIVCPPHMDLEDAIAIATIVATRKHEDWTGEDSATFLRAVYDFAETAEAVTHKTPDEVLDMVVDMVSEALDKVRSTSSAPREEKKENSDADVVSKFLTSIGF